MVEVQSVAIILMYDKEMEFVVQNRKNVKGTFADYGFFGGHVEKGETPEQTLKRELKEELEVNVDDLNNFEFFKQFKDHPRPDIEMRKTVFLAEVDDFYPLKVHEGKIIVIPSEIIQDLDMTPGDKEILKEIRNYLIDKK